MNASRTYSITAEQYTAAKNYFNPDYQLRNEITDKIVDSVYINKDITSMFDNALVNASSAGVLSEIKTIGIFSIRNIRGSTSTYSAHSYGIAVDVNASTNQLNTIGTQSTKLIKSFTNAGFTYGGTFTRPDPMHFSLGY